MAATIPFARAADYTITVDCRQTKAQTGFMQGFLHGFGIDQDLDPKLIGENLTPRFWRLGIDGWQRYQKVLQFNPRITMNVADLYSDSLGGMSNVQPWVNWAEWEAFCADQARFC